MPELPSGLKLALLIDHIMEPDLNWFKAREGHFWLWVPAPEYPPPFSPSQVWEQFPDTAPVPTTREMVAKYIRVCIGLESGMMYWRGEMLSDFPKYGSLSEEDFVEWSNWLDTQPVKEFLDSAITKCKMQVEVNKDAIGYAVVSDAKESDDGSLRGSKVIDDPTTRSH